MFFLELFVLSFARPCLQLKLLYLSHLLHNFALCLHSNGFLLLSHFCLINYCLGLLLKMCLELADRLIGLGKLFQQLLVIADFFSKAGLQVRV